MSVAEAVLLLGRRDEPVDGVADYCEKLREAGALRGLSFDLAAVHWAEKGWGDALDELRQSAAAWRDDWVFLQFTTLAWSRRGFPLRAPGVLDVLRQCGARPGVVFHDFTPLRGSGIIGRAREFSHLRAMRQLYARADLAIFTVPVDKITWLPPVHDKAVFIPVGSNFSGIGHPAERDESDAPQFGASTVSVFGITGGVTGTEEVADIVYALKSVHSRGVSLRLAALGRGSEVFEGELRKALNGSGIELSMLGLMSPENLVRALASAQVLLCVRGHVSSRRGSAIAGIVCGLPIVGYRGAETGFPVTEAGVKLVEARDREGLAQALFEVLTDKNLAQDLRQRSELAARKYFSWDAISSQFTSAMSLR